MVPCALGFLSNFAGPDLFVCFLIPIVGLVALVLTVLWILVLIEVITKEPTEGNDRIVWLLVVLFLHGLGALIYYLVRRPERVRLYGR